MPQDVSPRALLPGDPDSAAGAGVHPGLPARDYFDPEIYELEKERIFYRHWFCVGRESELPEAGTFVTRDVAGENPHEHTKGLALAIVSFLYASMPPLAFLSRSDHNATTPSRVNLCVQD